MRYNTIFFLSLLLISFKLNADEGMWLLPSLKEIEPELQKSGLQLNLDEIYHPEKTSIKDAIVIFGPGCTGEVISNQGLVLTNHHCGYSYIHSISSIKDNYIENGFWAKNSSDEILMPDLDVTFIEKIEDVTDFVKKKIAQDSLYGGEYFLSSFFLTPLIYDYIEDDFFEKNPYTNLEIVPLYQGNTYHLIYSKKYTDIRLVGAPPASIGKFGGDTDNWEWPRHTGDFALFRIYADSLGNPARYSEANIPLKPKRYIPVAKTAIKEDDFAFILGFPGKTSRYATSAEIDEQRNILNEILVQFRTEYLELLKNEMEADSVIYLKYQDKYFKSSNYLKNTKGTNRSIDKLDVIAGKRESEEKFRNWATNNNYPHYIEALDSIESKVRQRKDFMIKYITLVEALYSPMEFFQIPTDFDELIKAIENKDELDIENELIRLRFNYLSIFNDNYDQEVDKRITKKMLSLFLERSEENYLPFLYESIENQYNNNVSLFVDDLFDSSIFLNREKFQEFRKNPDVEKLKADKMAQFVRAVDTFYHDKLMDYFLNENDCSACLRTYTEGILRMQEDIPAYPDANFTIRLTYGTVKSYYSEDAVKYDYYTTLKGVMEKENEEDRSFNVPSKLKQLYESKDFEPYNMLNGEMPVCFITTNDITGGNSGSPVMNAQGELIGVAFDGNWEAMSCNFLYEPDFQRCIIVDIRYILFIIDKYANVKYLIDEILEL